MRVKCGAQTICFKHPVRAFREHPVLFLKCAVDEFRRLACFGVHKGARNFAKHLHATPAHAQLDLLVQSAITGSIKLPLLATSPNISPTAHFLKHLQTSVRGPFDYGATPATTRARPRRSAARSAARSAPLSHRPADRQ